MRRTRRRSTGLVEELQRSYAHTLGLLASVVVLSLLAVWYVASVSEPRIATYSQLATDSRELHEAMTDHQSALHGWLATGDPVFVADHRAAQAEADAAAAHIVAGLRQDPDGAPELVATLLSKQRWEGWAQRAAASPTAGRRDDGTLASSLTEGRRLFAAYDADAARSGEAVRAARTAAQTQQQQALLGVLCSFVVLLVVAGAAVARRSRRMRRTLAGPVDDLHQTILALRSGRLDARTGPTDVPELAEMGAALNRLASELSRAGTEAVTRERRLARLAYRFETVVRVGREVAGSLSVRHVSATVTDAASELLNASAVLWLHTDAGFEAMHRSRDPHGMIAAAHLVPPAIVPRTAAAGEVASELGRTAYPLVLAGRVTAVLEVATTEVDADTEQVLSALLSTAAASLESAHLHSTARDLADLDGLTALPNRRRFEADVDTEWERCRRYKRPLSLVMIDLDHFKRLNDEHGHLLGDEVLREVARVLVAGLRSTDTAYRYGGEEIVVLLRETRLEEATAAAERLRAAIGALRLPSHPDVRVSASAGVAVRRTTMAHYTELMADADRALYEAKRLGRDRVAATPVSGEPLVAAVVESRLLPGQPIPK